MKTSLFATLSLVNFCAFAQDMATFRFSNYAGIQATFENPADFANSPLKFDIPIFTFEQHLYNNYLHIRNQSIASSISISANEELVSLTDDNIREGKGDAKFALVDNADNPSLQARVNAYTEILAPGIAFHLPSGHNFGISYRFRNQIDIKDVDFQIAKIAFEGVRYRPLHNQNFTETNGRIHQLNWTEFNINYSRNLVYSNWFRFAFGATLKRLHGYNAAFIEFDNFTYRLQESDTNFLHIDIQALSGEMRYGKTNLDEPNLPFKNKALGKGWGIDIGFTAIDKGVGTYSELAVNTNYRWKAGIALTDLGRIQFTQNSNQFRILADKNVWRRFDSVKFEIKERGLIDVDTALSNALYGKEDSTVVASRFSMFTPPALRAQFEYRIFPHVMLGIHAVKALRFKSLGAYMGDLAVANARFELKHIELSTSASLYNWNVLRFGAAVRLGPLFIGTDDLLSYVVKQDLQSTSIYLGLKIAGLREADPRKAARAFTNGRLKKNKCYTF